MDINLKIQTNARINSHKGPISDVDILQPIEIIIQTNNTFIAVRLTSAYIVYMLYNKGNITLCLVLNNTFMNYVARLMFGVFSFMTSILFKHKQTKTNQET